MSLSKLAVLGALAEKPMHGYGLKHYFEEFGNTFWMINYGSIYPTLGKIQKEGFVTAKKESSATVDRIVYTITEKGRREFKALLKTRLEREMNVRDEFTLHLFFLDSLDRNLSREFLLRKRKGNEALLKDLKAREKTLKETMPKLRFEAARRGIMHIKTEILWLDKLLKEMKKEEIK